MITADHLLGIAAFLVFYFVFLFAIKKWDLKTPGREDDAKQRKSDLRTGEQLFRYRIAAKNVFLKAAAEKIFSQK